VEGKGSRNRQFVRRIPSDVRAKATGLKLSILVGTETQTISDRAQAVRVSLRTSDPTEVKPRHTKLADRVDPCPGQCGNHHEVAKLRTGSRYPCLRYLPFKPADVFTLSAVGFGKFAGDGRGYEKRPCKALEHANDE
jgi:hypothetical protein